MPKQCYRCEEKGTTREHFPPKAFFPPKENLQLRTVRSCEAHNNKKSGDDMYVLTQICMNAGKGDNLPKKIFMKSIVPQLNFDPRFKEGITQGAEWITEEARRYPVDIARFDRFFDALCCAIFFDRFKERFDPVRHTMGHIYLSLGGGDPMRRQIGMAMAKDFLAAFHDKIEHFEADHVDEVVYANHIVVSRGVEGPITIIHSFYGVFDVVSMLSPAIPPQWLPMLLANRPPQS